MRKLIMVLLVAAMILPLTGCLTAFLVEAIDPLEGETSVYLALFTSLPVETNAYFSVGEVKDTSKFKFFDGNKDTFDLKETMKTHLQLQLEADNSADNDSPQYVVNVSMSYNPINEDFFYSIRGKTMLSISAIIVDQKGNQLAYCRVYGMRDGLHNVSIFGILAEKLAEVIRNPDTRKVPLEFEYYEQAREEINNGTVDKGQWARSLVCSGDNEEMAKFEYIVFRGKQLYWSNPAE